jgi:outer membrane protein TolC
VVAPAVSVPNKPSKELIDQALRSHSNVAFQKAMLEVADKQLDASWMQFFPTLDVGWGLQYQFTRTAALGSQDPSRWSLVFTLSVPIYNHFRYADLDEKRAALKQAMIQLEDTKTTVTTAVRKAQRDYLAALASVRIADKQAKLAAEGLTLVEASYQAGTGSSLEVTDARRTISATNVNLAVKRLEAQVNLLALLRALGDDVLESVRNAPLLENQPVPEP